MSEIKTAAIVAKPRSDLAARLVPELIRWLEARGVAVRLDLESAAYASGAVAAKGSAGLPRENVADGLDLTVTKKVEQGFHPYRQHSAEVLKTS